MNRAIQSWATTEEAATIAKTNITKAFELDSSRSQVYSALGAYQIYFDYDFKGAETSIEKSISLNPNRSHQLYGHLLTILRRSQEALEQTEMALKLDPMNLNAKTGYGLTLYSAGRYNDAIEILQEVLKADPGNEVALYNLPLAFHEVGRYSEELEAWKVDYSTFFKGYANVFDQGYANGSLTGALNLQADSLVKQSKTKFMEPSEIAQLYACAGNKERTLEMLKKDYEVHDPGLPTGLRFPIYEFVHDEPRYQNLFQKINLPHKP